ncbi:ricin-type beta-trefoil lectin domain protein [Burkholderia pyrrocinia]|uniref:ricin-type beta-trefoil lectin domain protein n=1 Tax=Burkholderia pyrrocinia TaxID=60550 RepID=UPI001BCEC6EC|nr:ricin-type beta-trefoil lectin domain protein [Burkholderia pyrrocinia]QVN23005.1 ricin-type beta-trefoil lectin domain protein [Burkholderia pyrrocinia]
MTDGTPAGSNRALLGTCPTLASVRESGGRAFNSALWVQAGDGTIQTKNSYCLSAAASGAGSNVVLATCVQGAANQQWNIVRSSRASPGSQVVAKQSGLCMTPSASGTLSLQVCASSNSNWTTPGKSFDY